MNAWDGPAGTLEAPFSVRSPRPEAPSTPLIFASPHSGRIYPAPLMAACRLDDDQIRSTEDALVDTLVDRGPEFGARLITARYARVFVDVNREPFELDPAMFEDDLPPWVCARSPRVAAGLGAIARVAAEGQEIYARKLSFAEARSRIEAVHRPYHDALAELIAEAKAAHGLAVLIDWHSMPPSPETADIVLGDRFGGACAPALSRLVERTLAARGYRVARNAPYAGGFTTEHYGRPARGVHVLQVEMSRALYLDEERLAPGPGFARLKADLEAVFAALASADWRRLQA